MTHYSSKHDEKDSQTLLIGALLILLVGGYFIVRAFFFETDKIVEEYSQASSEIDQRLTIAPEIVRKKILNNESIKFIDLRTPDLYAAEHIPNSISLSVEALNSYLTNPNDILVIVYSKNDRQTYDTAKNIIEDRSLTAFFLEGGFEEWKSTNNQTIGPGNPNSFVDQSKIVYIDAAELLKLINTTPLDFALLDVQSKQNFDRVHIKNAINIPLDELEKRTKEIPSNIPLVVYGENEYASFQAGVRLADLNVFTAKTLSGNKNLTAESGLPLEQK